MRRGRTYLLEHAQVLLWTTFHDVIRLLFVEVKKLEHRVWHCVHAMRDSYRICEVKDNSVILRVSPRHCRVTMLQTLRMESPATRSGRLSLLDAARVNSSQIKAPVVEDIREFNWCLESGPCKRCSTSSD